MRESVWRITWDPAGASPRVLLDYGDLMDDEIARSVSQVVDVGRFDQAVNGRPYGRSNRKRRLEFTRELNFPTAVEAWAAMLESATQDPWGDKQVLKIAPLSGGSQFVRAAILNIEREPVTPPFPGYQEHVALRVNGGLTPSGSPLTVTGGWYNPPVVGGGTASGGITIILDGTSTGITTGNVVKVTGITGVADGNYQVTGVSTGGGKTQVDIDAASNQRPREELTGMHTWASGQLCVANYPLAIHAFGCPVDGSLWQFRIDGTAPQGLSSPVFGVRTANAGAPSTIQFGVWHGSGFSDPPPPLTNPLPLDGTSGYPNRRAAPYDHVTQTGPTSITVELLRDGAVVDTQVISPSWSSEVSYHPSEDATSVVGPTATITLHGNGETDRLDTGIAEQITGGSVQKLS